jgi:hypothetical protein
LATANISSPQNGHARCEGSSSSLVLFGAIEAGRRERVSFGTVIRRRQRAHRTCAPAASSPYSRGSKHSGHLNLMGMAFPLSGERRAACSVPVGRCTGPSRGGAARGEDQGPSGPPFLTPAAAAPRGSAKPDFFLTTAPDSGKLKRSARRPERRERGQ